MTCFQIHILSPYSYIQNTTCLLFSIGQSSPRGSPGSGGFEVEGMFVVTKTVN